MLEAKTNSLTVLEGVLRALALSHGLVVLYELRLVRSLGYQALKRSTHLPDQVLNQALSRLLEAGLLKRTELKPVPPRTDYALTTLGEGVVKSLLELEMLLPSG